jgi:hypothetical protein
MPPRRPTLSDLVDCARREVALRQRVYERWVTEHRMTSGKADWEIACMSAILARLEHELHSCQPTLF